MKHPLYYLWLEWQKFGPNLTFRMLMAAYVILFLLALVLTCLIGRAMEFSMNGESIRPAADLFEFPRSWELTAYVGSWLNVMVLGLLGVFMMAQELGQRTLRQNIISGMTRRDVFFSKISALLAISAIATCCYLVLGALAGVMSGGLDEIGAMTPHWWTTLAFFMQCVGYLLLGTMLGMLIRQTILAVLAFFAYVLFLEGLARWIVNLTSLKSRLLDFLPDHVLESLTAFPVPELAQEMVDQHEILKGLTPVESGISVLVYLVLFSGLLYWRYRKADF